ncbi:hypothetical protein AGMMS49944_32030 [Spirochaetia bacterium]|nr:hypothetical protein AGMMS49944_32030 [Spirochaetia bacterium]
MTRVTQYNQNNLHGYRLNYTAKILWRAGRKCLHILNKIKTRPLDYDFYGGANWTNYTHNCVKKIFEYLQKDKKYINRFKWTNCADEIFYQTIIHQNDGLNIEDNCLRYVDWESGPEYPRTLRMDDYETIMKSGALFARKFDFNVDKKIMESIYEKIQ